MAALPSHPRSSPLRLLCSLLGVALAALSIIATVAACSVVAAMTYVYYTESRLSPRDRTTWLWAAGGVLVGGVLSWASIRLANHGRPAHQRVRSLRVDPESVQRWERWPGLNTTAAMSMAAGAGWCLAAGHTREAGWLAAGWAAGFFLLTHGYLLWHELGHLAAGKLVGLEPLSLRIGAGPLIWRQVTAHGFWWEWRLWPAWGVALSADRQARPVAWRFFLCIVGGPLGGGLFMALALYALVRDGTFDALRLNPALLDYGSLLAVLSLFLLVAPSLACLLPHSSVREGVLYHSDGWWLCRAFFLPAALFRERAYHATGTHLYQLWHAGFRAQARRETELILAQFPQRRTALTLLESHWHRRRKELPEAEAYLRRGLEESTTLTPSHRAATLAQHAGILALSDDPDAARACCETVLARLPEAERVLYLDAFACVPIYHRTAALLPDAQRWCAEALERSPEAVTLRGTQGAILYEQGRFEEALPILRQVGTADGASDADRGLASFYLALNARRLGQRAEAKTLRKEALRWCKVPAIIRRIGAELPLR